LLRVRVLSVSSLLDRFFRQKLRKDATISVCTFSILAVGSFLQTPLSNIRKQPAYAFSILAVGSFLQTFCASLSARSVPSFSILAVGSFLQTAVRGLASSINELFQYPRCWIVSSDHERRHVEVGYVSLSVSSLLDRFFRLLAITSFHSGACGFQYPRCWIVSSDGWTPTGGSTKGKLSVSSLLDRFFRRFALPVPANRPVSFSILAVGSFLQTPTAAIHALIEICSFSILAVGSFLQTHQHHRRQHCHWSLSVSSLLDRFFRRLLPNKRLCLYHAFSILAVGSFLQTAVHIVPPRLRCPFSILAVGSFLQTIADYRPELGDLRLSVSSLLDRFFRQPRLSGRLGGSGAFSILAVGSFLQT